MGPSIIPSTPSLSQTSSLPTPWTNLFYFCYCFRFKVMMSLLSLVSRQLKIWVWILSSVPCKIMCLYWAPLLPEQGLIRAGFYMYMSNGKKSAFHFQHTNIFNICDAQGSLSTPRWSIRAHHFKRNIHRHMLNTSKCL